jgi:hypothetical protein
VAASETAASQSGMIPTDEYFKLLIKGKQVDFKPFTAMAEKDKPFTDFLIPARKAGFELFMKRARVGAAKHVRVRPRISNWEVHGTLEIIDEALTETAIRAIFAQTRKVGLGDWRAGCTTPGRFGSFVSELQFEMTSDD